jgi:hypothetical protein
MKPLTPPKAPPILRHFAYETPDTKVLCQGDLLEKKPRLIEVLEEYHPYFVKPQYKYFLVLTQSCSLVRRDDEPSASHIVLAAVRPVDDAIRREAKKHQEWWQEGLGIISAKNFDKLRELVERIVDNSEPGYFYLPEEVALGISDNYCAFLRVAISLKRMHYDTCLDAKIAQLEEPFQAKLGWLVGTLYNQVGTTEWDEKYGRGKRSAHASKLIKSVVQVYADERITETTRDLCTGGKTLRQFSLDDIQGALEKKRIKPPKAQFADAASKALQRSKFIDRICSHAYTQFQKDNEALDSLVALLEQAGIDLPDNLPQIAGRVWKHLLSTILTDENFAGRDKVLEYIIANLVADPTIDRLISNK